MTERNKRFVMGLFFLVLNATLGLLAFWAHRVHADDNNALFHDRDNTVQVYKVKDGSCTLYVGFGYGLSSAPTPITITLGPGCK